MGGHWLLLERTEQLLIQLYLLGEDPNPIRLFDDTELADCEEESPLLIDAKTNPSLLSAMRSQPNDWPGLILESFGELPDLLSHLRHILFIRFEGERRGVLRYSRPRTASYFFPACDFKTLALWLGPIQAVNWFGGTWRDSASDRESWHRLENHQANQWRPDRMAQKFALAVAHEQALQRQQGEHFLYQWWQQQNDTSFETAWQYLTEGMQAGFVSAESLSSYLGLRNANPHIHPPASLPHGNDKERLQILAQHMATSSHDKEITA